MGWLKKAGIALLFATCFFSACSHGTDSFESEYELVKEDSNSSSEKILDEQEAESSSSEISSSSQEQPSHAQSSSSPLQTSSSTAHESKVDTNSIAPFEFEYKDYELNEIQISLDKFRNTILDSAKVVRYSVAVPIEAYNTKKVYGELRTFKEDFYTAFANQYPLMYKDYVVGQTEFPVPVSIIVANTSYTAKNILVKTQVPGYSEEGSTTQLVAARSYVTIAPSITFTPSSYTILTDPAKAQLNIQAFELNDGEQSLFYSESKDITIYPPQINGAEGVNVINRNCWYAVWVTPNMEPMTSIHTELSKMLGGSLKAYQLYSKDENIAQSSRRLVSAVFELVKRKGISYVNNPNAGVIGQKIKYPVEVLRTSQANCIETVNLFASILESLGMETYIVLVPGHAMLGYRPTKDASTLEFVETTMALNNNYSADDAIVVATTDFIRRAEAGEFSNGTSGLVDITAARLIGILPNSIP